MKRPFLLILALLLLGSPVLAAPVFLPDTGGKAFYYVFNSHKPGGPYTSEADGLWGAIVNGNPTAYASGPSTVLSAQDDSISYMEIGLEIDRSAYSYDMPVSFMCPGGQARPATLSVSSESGGLGSYFVNISFVDGSSGSVLCQYDKTFYFSQILYVRIFEDKMYVTDSTTNFDTYLGGGSQGIANVSYLPCSGVEANLNTHPNFAFFCVKCTDDALTISRTPQDGDGFLMFIYRLITVFVPDPELNLYYIFKAGDTTIGYAALLLSLCFGSFFFYVFLGMVAGLGSYALSPRQGIKAFLTTFIWWMKIPFLVVYRVFQLILRGINAIVDLIPFT